MTTPYNWAVTTGTETLRYGIAPSFVGAHLTAKQAAMIFYQGEGAVAFALLSSVEQLTEKPLAT